MVDYTWDQRCNKLVMHPRDELAAWTQEQANHLRLTCAHTWLVGHSGAAQWLEREHLAMSASYKHRNRLCWLRESRGNCHQGSTTFLGTLHLKGTSDVSNSEHVAMFLSPPQDDVTDRATHRISVPRREAHSFYLVRDGYC